MYCRLSDVVKGTAKPKSTNSKEKDNGAMVCTSPRPTSPASPIPKATSVPEMKPQQPPPPPPPPPPSQQPSQIPLSVQAQSSASSCDREAKDVGTSSDPSLPAVSQTPPSSPDKYVCVYTKGTMYLSLMNIIFGDAVHNTTISAL
jgi:hypothetical protein